MKRTVLGRRSNGSYGLYISKSGKDVDAISDPEDFVFNSDLGAAAVIHASGVATLGSTIFFPSLPYVPVVLSWALPNNGTEQGTRLTELKAYRQNFDGTIITYERSGPVVQATASSAHFPAPQSIPSLFGAFRTDYQVKYAVLRIPGGA